MGDFAQKQGVVLVIEPGPPGNGWYLTLAGIMLSERAGEVLNILVDEYINPASLVASEDNGHCSPVKVSSASIRSTMSQLAEEGYISRPHFVWSYAAKSRLPAPFAKLVSPSLGS